MLKELNKEMPPTQQWLQQVCELDNRLLAKRMYNVKFILIKVRTIK